MKTYIITLLFGLLIVLPPFEASANNAAAGELSYTLVSGNTYRFIYKGYFDCAGSQAPASVYLCVSNTCNNTNTHYLLNKWTGTITYGLPNGSNVPVGCLKPQTQCDNPSLALRGFKEFWYTADVTLTDTCSNWEFSSKVNSRTNFDNIVAGNQFLRITFDNTTITNNSSPYFTSPAVIYRSKYDQLTLSNHLSDPDGDSLVLDVIRPYTHSGTTNLCPTTPSQVALIPHTPPISFPNNPLPTLWGNSFYIDSLNTVNVTADSTGVYLVTYLIKEYRNGQLIGTIMRDAIFVINNANTYIRHKLDTASISGLQYFNPGTYISCPGDTIKMCYQFWIPDSNAAIFGHDSIGTTAPGAKVSYTGQGTDTVKACMEWVPTPVDTGIFRVRFWSVDSSCYPPGLSYAVWGNYNILVRAKPAIKINTPWPNPAWPYVEVNFTASITPCFNSWFQWQVNGKDVPRNTANPQIWSSTLLNDGDHVRCLYKCYDTLCMDTSVVTSNTITVKVKTGINKTIDIDRLITIYPNPNNGTFNLKTDISFSGKPIHLNVMNLFGQSVYATENYRGGQIDISGAAPGMYVLLLRDGEKQYKTNFVVQ